MGHDRATILDRTNEEMEFVLGLGTYVEGQTLSKTELLRRYLRGCANRADWDGIDGRQVMRFAQSRIGILESIGVL